MTELSDYSDTRSETVTRAESAQSAQSDRYSHVIEAMLEDYSDTGEASKSSETEAELVSDADETDAELVLKALGNPKFKWRTIPGVVEETGLDPETVANALSEFNGVVVKSSRYTTDGRALYTTRSRYEEFTPLWRKILGAVKNQID
jgi:hypothetical protein